MNYGKIIAWIEIILCFGASVGYAFAKDWHRSAYWFFAGCITAVVTI